MRIVMIGVGAIGNTILKSLSAEGHEITVIDEDSERVERLIEQYDVFGVVGNGACRAIQLEAHMAQADLALALTDSDELNVFACLVAKKIGVQNTIARVRNPEYRQQIMDMKNELGISMIVNPERDVATEMYYLINLPPIAKLESFAKGRAVLVEIVVDKGCLLIGQTLAALGKKLTNRVLVCAVQRGEEVMIPAGNFMIKKGDRIHFTANAANLRDFLSEIQLVTMQMRNIMIVGGNKTSFYLADDLCKKKYQVKLITHDAEAAEELAELLPRASVIYGNFARQDLLLEEGLPSMDAFVALTQSDEGNIIASMFANRMKVKKTITQIKHEDLFGMMRELGTRNTVSPAEIVANKVISYIRALSNKRGSNILNLYRVVENRVEAIEFLAQKNTKIYDIPLKELKIRENCLIACIIRKNEVLIPCGDTCIKLGDNVVVVTTHKNFDDLTDILEQ